MTATDPYDDLGWYARQGRTVSIATGTVHEANTKGLTWSDDKPAFAQTFAAIFDEAFQVLISRQRKYGPGNIERQGIYGVITRITDDKAERLKRALNGTIVNGRVDIDIAQGDSDDTFEDACLDLANYALILLALRRGQWGGTIEDDDPAVRLVLQ